MIIFITYTVFENRDFIRYGISELKNKGFDILVLDLSILQYPKLDLSYNETEYYNCGLAKKVRSYDALDNILNLYNKTENFIVSVGRPKPIIYKKIKKFKGKVGFQFLGALPNTVSNISTKKIFQFTIKELINKILGRLTVRKLIDNILNIYLYRIKQVDFVFYAGNKCINNYFGNASITQEISCHSYDFYLNQLDDLKNNNSVAEVLYVLFIDQMLPFHPDNERFSRDLSLEANDYYERMNLVFDYIEREFKLKVIISGHPRNKIDKKTMSGYFKGREYTVYNTKDLVKSAELCLIHYSTALSQLVMFKKKFIFVWDDIIRENNTTKFFMEMLKYFNASSLSTKCEKLEKIIINENNENIKNYYDSYISDDKADKLKTNGDIMADFFINSKQKLL